MSPGPVPAPDRAVAATSVAANLALFRGVWLDLVVAYHPDGTPMDHDDGGTASGPFPYQQLVYLDFDGERLTQTNLPVRGRPPVPRTFRGTVHGGILEFDPVSPTSPRTLGVAGGPGVLIFLPDRVDTDVHRRLADPDYIRYLGGEQRTRTATLYRDGELRRILTVSGTRIHSDPTRRVPDDPRGPDGPVHEPEEPL